MLTQQEVQALKEPDAKRSNYVQRYTWSSRFSTQIKKGKTKEVITMVQVEIARGTKVVNKTITKKSSARDRGPRVDLSADLELDRAIN